MLDLMKVIFIIALICVFFAAVPIAGMIVGIVLAGIILYALLQSSDEEDKKDGDE